jgi:hypothetical protein
LENNRLKTVCDLASVSHARIQKDFADINPMVGVNQKMRDMDVPADAVTIDQLSSGKRIILILHDHYPDVVNYQFSFKNQDPDDEFEQIAFKELTADKLYEWMKSYFGNSSS